MELLINLTFMFIAKNVILIFTNLDCQPFQFYLVMDVEKDCIFFVMC